MEYLLFIGLPDILQLLEIGMSKNRQIKKSMSKIKYRKIKRQKMIFEKLNNEKNAKN